MIFKKNILQFLALLLCIEFYPSTPAQTLNTFNDKEIGRLLIKNYGPKDFKSSPQNLVILQDFRGIVYVGNNSGMVLEFDGANWKHIKVSDQQVVWSLAEDKNGRIYVGTTNDLGLLKPDTNGNLHYQSLLKELKDKNRIFSGIHSIYPTHDGIYFCSREYLFRWKDNYMKSWRSKTGFDGFFCVYDSLYVLEKHKGLMVLKSDSLEFISGGKIFLDKPVKAMFPASIKHGRRSSILIGIDSAGLFLYDWQTLKPLKGKASEFIKHNGIRCGTILNDSIFAAGLLKGGAIIFNNKGDVIQYLNKSSGLHNNIIYSISPDHQGGMWMTELQGIDHLVNIYPTFSVFDEQRGLNGVTAFNSPPVRFRNILYVVTSEGVQYLDEQQNRFFEVSGLSGDFWKLFSDDKFLYAIRGSIRKIDGANSSFIKKLSDGVSCIRRSKIDSNKYYIANFNGGIKVLRKTKNDWIESRKLKGWNGSAGLIAEDKNGDIWLGKGNEGITRMHVSPENEISKIEIYGKEQGLPLGNNYPFFTSRGMLFTTNSSIYRFDSDNRKFFIDTTFNKLLPGNSYTINYLTEDKKGNVWAIISKDITFYLNIFRLQPNGTYILDNDHFLGIPSNGIWSIYAEDNGITWFGGEEGLFRYNDNLPKVKQINFPAVIRSVLIHGDSVIYGGSLNENKKLNVIELSHTNNTLSFGFSALFYDHPEQNTFQIFLEGFDKKWSNWTSITQKEYSRLPAGEYVFHVRAKNIYGHESSEDTFAFTLLPPPYLSWWAYCIYGFIFFSFLILTINRYKNWHTSKLRERTKELETIVKIRTTELASKNMELQELSKIKSRFFANISHEFRTPLTLIVGQIENLLPDLKKEHNIKRAKMALRNSKQLQLLINQLLDLSKFDAREMKLKASEQNIVPLLRYLTGSFESFAERKNIVLKFESSIDNIPVYFDQDKIEKIMHNLLSNALKFTSAGGKVLVSVNVQSKGREINLPEDSENIIEGDVKIVVQDSGIGIPIDRLAHIFDRFFQVDNSTTREYEGTGIGLALTKELVQVHGGGISVESKEGFGTTFIILIPLGKKHLEPDQIAEIETGSLDLPELDLEKISELSNNEELINKESESISNQKSKLILIVEDNPDMRTYINETLAEYYNIKQASNGEEGLEIAIEEIPDLIITDVMMPKMDGYELTRKLRTNQVTNHIPIIMLTAKAAESDKLEGLETGVDAFLIKPFSTKELGIRVRKLIEIRDKLIKQIGAKAVLNPSEISVSSMDQQFLKRMHDIIEENMGNEDFGVEVLAEQIGISKRQLQRKLKTLIDCTPIQCIRIMRLKRAKQLLEQNAGNVTEIAFSVGYGDVTAFSRAFKEEFDILPSALISPKK